MLLQTNSYVVPRDKRAEHARLLRKFRQTLARLGCDHFEVYEQVGSNWSSGETTGRFVQIMRFRDRRHQQAVQAAERSDPAAQTLIQEFCELINFPYQQQQGLFAVGFYTSALPIASPRARHAGPATAAAAGEAVDEAPVSSDAEPDIAMPPPEEDELVVEVHEAVAVPATPTPPPLPESPSADDSSLGNLSGDVEQSDLLDEPLLGEEPTVVEGQPANDDFVAEELAMEETPEESTDEMPEEPSGLPDTLDLDDLAELRGSDEQGNDTPRSA